MLKHLDHLNFTVRDLDESVEWYGKLFDFEAQESGIYQGKRWTIMRSGEALLCLYEHKDLDFASPSSRGIHGLSHFGLRVSDGPAFQARAKSLGVPVKFGGVTHWPNSDSYYVDDPTGYEIEVAAWHGDTVRF